MLRCIGLRCKGPHIDTQKKRRPRVAYSLNEAFALPKESNKQQETYADMTIHYTHTGAVV